jgi:peptidyl-prolyl cis-trans isomerase B (cyclophilin B)
MKRRFAKKDLIMAVTMALLLAFGLGLAACSDGDSGNSDGGSGGAEPSGGAVGSSSDNSAAAGGSSVNSDSDSATHPVIEITMEDGGVIDVELSREAAPITVDNFLKLINAGFYDGLTFHRVIDKFMIQGGDPDGNGGGGSGENIKGEFAQNGWENPISHVRGVISMARSNNPDSASSQFFITNADATSLDGKYAAFGTVTKGMDVVDKIAQSPKDAGDMPLEPVVIQSIRVLEE